MEEEVNVLNINKIKTLPHPTQNPFEWRLFIEFIETYFRNREMDNLIVVELGSGENKQKAFYEQLLSARHIGIDISLESHPPDIVGNTHDETTLQKLRELLAGEKINLLFIDANHRYDDVKKDYEMYSPLVKNIIAFHDIMTEQVGVKDFWKELIFKDEYTKITFYRKQMQSMYQYGIGIIIKE